MVQSLIIDYYENVKKEIAKKVNAATEPYQLDQLKQDFIREYLLWTIIKDDQKDQLTGSEIRKETVDGKPVEITYFVIAIPIRGGSGYDPEIDHSIGSILNRSIGINYEKKMNKSIDFYQKDIGDDIKFKEYYGDYLIIESKAVESEIIAKKDKVSNALKLKNQEVTEQNNELIRYIKDLIERRHDQLTAKKDEVSELAYNLRSKISDVKW